MSPGFISYIVEPLFEEWQRFTEPSLLSRTMLGHLQQNKARWSSLQRPPSSSGTQTGPGPTGSTGEDDGEDIP